MQLLLRGQEPLVTVGDVHTARHIDDRAAGIECVRPRSARLEIILAGTTVVAVRASKGIRHSPRRRVAGIAPLAGSAPLAGRHHLVSGARAVRKSAAPFGF